MSKSGENTKSGSSEEVKKALKVHRDGRINSSKGAGETRVVRTSYTKMKNPMKIESSDDEWDEDYKISIMSGGWSDDQV